MRGGPNRLYPYIPEAVRKTGLKLALLLTLTPAATLGGCGTSTTPYRLTDRFTTINAATWVSKDPGNQVAIFEAFENTGSGASGGVADIYVAGVDSQNRPLNPIEINRGAYDIQLSPDGKYIAVLNYPDSNPGASDIEKQDGILIYSVQKLIDLYRYPQLRNGMEHPELFGLVGGIGDVSIIKTLDTSNNGELKWVTSPYPETAYAISYVSAEGNPAVQGLNFS